MTGGDLLDRFSGRRAVVIGDLMLDEYMFGQAARISPEAPVMVIRHERTDRVPGGAANVARNLHALGAHTHLIGVVGDDEGGDVLRRSLEHAGVDSHALLVDPQRQTTRKTRVLADHAHQVLRIDAEDDSPISTALEGSVLEAVRGALGQADVVLLSDYLKGALTPAVVEGVVQAAAERGIPVVANPKPRSLGSYRGATLVSLNRREATEAAGRHRSITEDEAAHVAAALLETHGLAGLLITLGEAGMLAVGPDVLRVRAPRVEVADPAGAGDTVVAAVALGLATIGFRREVFELAARLSAAVVRHVGVAVPNSQDLQVARAAFEPG